MNSLFRFITGTFRGAGLKRCGELQRLRAGKHARGVLIQITDVAVA